MAVTKMKSRRLAVFGAFGGVNIGDEVILEADIAMAQSVGYGLPITAVTSVNPAGHGGNNGLYGGPDREIVFFKNIKSVLTALFGKDLFIGGGQVIDGASGPKLPLIQLIFALWTRLGGGTVTIGGVGVNSMNGKAVQSLYRLLFLLCKDISVRDQASLEMLQFSSGARRRGRVAADVVFGLDLAKFVPVSNTDRDRIVFAVHAAPHVSYMDQQDAAKLLKRLSIEYPGKVDVVVHDNREAFDLAFATRLVNQVGAHHIKIVSFDTVQECLNYYQSARLVISARMHPLIIGAISGCSVIPLKGSSKVSEFARLVGLGAVDLAQTDVALEAVAKAGVIDQQTLAELALAAKSTMS